jgi:uncharacterized membrane protein
MIKRKTANPWIYRWSRPILAAIASLGLVLTAYLTVLKLSGNEAVCPIQGCSQVLNSPYAEIFGLPLSLFGAIAYLGMAILAIAPLVFHSLSQSTEDKLTEEKPEDLKTIESKNLEQKLLDWTWLLLLTGGVGMTIFSSYLMYLLAFKIQLPCTYCIASAFFSLSLLIVTIFGKKWKDVGQLWLIGLIVAMLSLVTTLGIFAQVEKNAALGRNGSPSNIILPPTGRPINGIGWEITSISGAAEIELAKHLTAIGAKEYVAWWCPHCHEQKMLLGREAVAEINQIECDPAGKNPKPQLCQESGIRGFPSWQINGQIYGGIQSPEKLAEISGYKGDRNFRYRLPQKK